MALNPGKMGFVYSSIEHLPKTESDMVKTVDADRETFKKFGEVF